MHSILVIFASLLAGAFSTNTLYVATRSWSEWRCRRRAKSSLQGLADEVERWLQGRIQ